MKSFSSFSLNAISISPSENETKLTLFSNSYFNLRSFLLLQISISLSKF